MKVIMTLLSSLLYVSSVRRTKFVDGFITSLHRNNLRISNTFKYSIHTLRVAQEQVSIVQPPLKVNLLTIHEEELETLLQSWKQPKYRAKQIIDWVKEKGVSDFDDMNNLPKSLRTILKENTTIGTLKLDVEMISKDGTRKRAYRLHDGQLIESVLMPYEDGRNTACISSQAGCAMACSFCATGQMGFARQLSPDEIYEQVARFSSELRAENKRLSNVVMMGMGEPLANYRNVIEAIKRMNTDLGIGARKITVSTVGIVPNIKKLIEEDIQVRLAVSLHCASEEERSALLPANKRYGGIDTLMETVKEYIDRTNRRVTFEWALIENGTFRANFGSGFYSSL
jgi:23S rRNA (adenine2503-C2)-methyltransferase